MPEVIRSYVLRATRGGVDELAWLLQVNRTRPSLSIEPMRGIYVDPTGTYLVRDGGNLISTRCYVALSVSGVTPSSAIERRIASLDAIQRGVGAGACEGVGYRIGQRSRRSRPLISFTERWPRGINSR